MLPTVVLTTLLLALLVSANPVLVNRSPVTLSLSRRLNLTSVHNLVRHDQARAKALKLRGTANPAGPPIQHDAVVSVPVTNQAVDYIAQVGVGSPTTAYNLIIDTGSSNTWVGAGQKYVKTSTSKSTGNTSVSYGSGSFQGTEYIDQVTIATGLVIPQQSIGVASTSSGFGGVDGILGIGPVDLTEGTVVNTKTVPTVTDTLFSSGTISSNEIGISFEPTTTEESTNGELTFGGTDSSKFTGTITYTPITSTVPAGYYWGIDQSIKYGGNTILASTAGIVDTGTTLLLIATDAFNKYQKATGAAMDATTGLLRLTATQFNNLKSLDFNIGGTTFKMTPNAQIWPRSLNTAIGGDANSIYLVVADLGSNSGEGLDFINGYAFLERFYSVFDTTNNRVGLATTPFTTATTN